MSPVTYLQVPSAKSFRRRAASTPEGQDRYVSVGGFVSIENLGKGHEIVGSRKFKRQYGFFGSISPRSRSSRYSPDSNQSQSCISGPTTPRLNEDQWSTPVTPQTPFWISKQTTSPSTPLQTLHVATPPPVSRYNSSDSVWILNSLTQQKSFQIISVDSPCDVDQYRLQPRFVLPVELEGSLLLPSQGFPQSDPPNIPPRERQRSSSAPTDAKTSFRVPVTTVNHNKSSSLGQPNQLLISTEPAAESEDPDMGRHLHHRKASSPASSYEPLEKVLVPLREFSRQMVVPMPQCASPPIPLSQMTMEQLMEVLPTLDAAIVAHDWVPCVKKRHQEVKALLQRVHFPPASPLSRNSLSEDFGKIFEQSQDIARTYNKLFEVARDLQDSSLHQKATEVEEAHAQRSEAMIALTRSVSKHKVVCQSYERELLYLRDMTRQAFEMLSEFVHQNPSMNASDSTGQKVQAILRILEFGHESPDHPQRHVSSELYHETAKALKEAYEAKRSLQEVCDEQRVTIRDQSRELDHHVARASNAIRKIGDKDHQIRLHEAENEELRQFLNTKRNADTIQEVNTFSEETVRRTKDKLQALRKDMSNDIFTRDAEIANLRRKLEKSFVREKELQGQIRLLLQTSQADDTSNRSSRFKRLFVGSSRETSSLPTSHSMHDLSQDSVMPLDKVKPRFSPPSPSRSGRTSPSLTGLCGSSSLVDLELPPPRINHGRNQSCGEFGPRMREGVLYPKDNDIGNAVSGRFHHVPSNVQSVTSLSRTQSSRSHTESPSGNQREHSRLRFDSASELSEISARTSRQQRVDLDQPSMVSHQRELSGITEVTEDSEPVKQRSSSPDSADRRMFLDSLQVLKQL